MIFLEQGILIQFKLDNLGIKNLLNTFLCRFYCTSSNLQNTKSKFERCMNSKPKKEIKRLIIIESIKKLDWI